MHTLKGEHQSCKNIASNKRSNQNTFHELIINNQFNISLINDYTNFHLLSLNMASTNSTHTIRWGFSGFGPRNSILVKDVVVALLAEREMVKKTNFNLDFHIFEQNGDENEAGAGHAFQSDCDATINSDITGEIPLANSHQIPGKYKHIVSAASDLAGSVAEELEANLNRYETEFRQRNPAAFTLLKENTDEDGRVNTTRAFATRGLIGKVQGKTIREVLEFARKEVPEIQVTVHYGHTVVGADFSVPTEPKLLVSKNKDKTEEWFDFDFVQLANGTTGRVPVSDDVASKAFSSTPNIDAIRSFLDKHGVLDAEGLIKQGSRIGVTGIRLSGYDCIPLLMNLTKILVVTDDGWRIDEEEAKKYKGLLSFISHHEGDVAPPRHTHTLDWPGKISLLNTEEMHTILLQQNFDWLSFAIPILKANVAAEIGTLPSKIYPAMTTEERFADYHRQTSQHRLNMTTETGLLRAGKLAMLEGFGFESDPDLANQSLVLKAPFTREHRAGFPFRYSGAYDITQPAVARAASNTDFFNHWGTFWSHIAASPVAIQDMIAQLFGLGVAKFAKGSFREIELKPESQEIKLGDHSFDVLFAPKVLTSTADVLLQSIKGQVKEMAPGVPDYCKGRFIANLNGDPISAIDVGSGGHGTTETLPDGTRTVVGVQWADTNNHLSASDQAATSSRTLLLLSALKAQGSKEPVKSLLQTYNETLPSQSEFGAEVAALEPTWREVNERSCFLKALERCFSSESDSASFTNHAEQGISRSGREACIGFLEKGNPGVKTFYVEELAKIPPFKPVSRDHFFFRRHLDFTQAEIERIWSKVFKI